MELTRAQETQLRRTGREAMEKVMAAAQQATQNGIQRATAKVTAVNGDCTADVDFGTDDYPMPLTGLRYTTGCCSMQVGDRVLVDTVSNQPLITGILANADNGPYVKWSSGIVTVQRIGSVVCLVVDGVASPGGSWGSGTLATLPAALRPPYQIRAAATVQNTIATAIIEVTTSGAVVLEGKGAYGLGDGDNWVFASAAWVVR